MKKLKFLFLAGFAFMSLGAFAQPKSVTKKGVFKGYDFSPTGALLITCADDATKVCYKITFGDARTMEDDAVLEVFSNESVIGNFTITDFTQAVRNGIHTLAVKIKDEE
jgi:hypothetical protein